MSSRILLAVALTLAIAACGPTPIPPEYDAPKRPLILGQEYPWWLPKPKPRPDCGYVPELHKKNC